MLNGFTSLEFELQQWQVKIVRPTLEDVLRQSPIFHPPSGEFQMGGAHGIHSPQNPEGITKLATTYKMAIMYLLVIIHINNQSIK
jgi:hypothetical protein